MIPIDSILLKSFTMSSLNVNLHVESLKRSRWSIPTSALIAVALLSSRRVDVPSLNLISNAVLVLIEIKSMVVTKTKDRSSKRAVGDE
jgi:hypothetical protein